MLLDPVSVDHKNPSEHKPLGTNIGNVLILDDSQSAKHIFELQYILQNAYMKQALIQVTVLRKIMPEYFDEYICHLH